MSCLQAVISGKDLESPKDISIQSSTVPLHNSIMLLQKEVNIYLTQLIKNREDEDTGDCDESDSEESDYETENDVHGLEAYLNRDFTCSRLVKKYKMSEESNET